MTGNKLRKLEKGFLDGTLTEEEEAELQVLVKEKGHHPLKAYFDWTALEPDSIPDLGYRVGKTGRPWSGIWFKVAATLIVLMAAGFLLKEELFHSSPEENFSQVEIDKSYKATMETLSAMAQFLNKGLEDTKEGIDLSKPFENLNELKNENRK